MAKDEVDDDALFAALSKDEIGELVELLDPDNSCLPPSERMPPQTTKEATGSFDRDHLLTHLKHEAESSKVGEDYIRYEKDVRGKVYKLKEVATSTVKDTKKSKFEEELDQMFALVEQDDLADLASELGLDEIAGQLQTANPRAGLHNSALYSYKSSASPPPLYSEPEAQETDIEERIVQLQELDPLLTVLNLNNHPGLSAELFERLCGALLANTYLTTLQLAGTGIGDEQAKVLAPVLKHNSTLVSLNLDSNKFAGSGIKMIVSSLQENSTLQELKISNQKYSTGAGTEMQVAKLLSRNTSLVKFGYSFTAAGPRVLVEKYMMRNTDLVRQQRQLL